VISSLIHFIGIYMGITMIERHSFAVQKTKAAEAAAASKATDHMRDLISFHGELLNEYHDFFVATQHPSASPVLRNLAKKYAMPIRMWSNGIHSFLETFLTQGPHWRHSQLEHMVAFMHYVRQLMEELHYSLPHMADEWTMVEDALNEYLSMLEDFQSSSFSDIYSGPYPSASSSSTNPWNLPRTSLFQHLYDCTYTYSRRSYMEDASEFVARFFRNHDTYNAPESSSSSSLSDTEQLPEHIVRTLIGWLFFGQGISWKSFNIYAKVFGVLSIAAKHYCRYFFRRF
jgi:hypothetical protein